MGFKKQFQHECEAEFKSREGKDNFVDYEFKDYKGVYSVLLLRV